jgi:hypothetical protein
LTEAGARIVQLYDAWGKRDKADEWRRKLGGTIAADKSAKPGSESFSSRSWGHSSARK